MEPVNPAPKSDREERFLRGQLRVRKTSRRMPKLRLLAFFALLTLSAGAVWMAIARGRAPELAIDRILVVGNERLSEGEILELIEVRDSTNILTLDLDETRRKLLRSSWVKDVELKRMLPATLTLEIVERSPVAALALSELYLLAEDGTILDQVPPFYDLGKLVLVRGVSGGDAEGAALAGEVAGALSSDERLSLLVSEVDVGGGASSVALRLRESPLTLLVSRQSMVPRLLEVVPLLAGIEERLPALEVLDLRFDSRVYARWNEISPGESQGSAVIVPGGAPF